MTPARGLLEDFEILRLAERTIAHGGKISYKTNPDGSQSVYELNITLYDALNNPATPDPEVDIPRFIASQALMLSLAGVPGIYIHSLFGSRNCQVCFEATGRARSLNRQKFSLADLETWLKDPGNLHHSVFAQYRRLLNLRRDEAAFHPQASQVVLQTDGQIFGLIRKPADDEHTLVCLINVSFHRQTFSLDLASNDIPPDSTWRDIISGDHTAAAKGRLHLTFTPYQVMWLKPAK